MRRAVLALLLGLPLAQTALPQSVLAQTVPAPAPAPARAASAALERATLVADSVTLQSQDQLLARGHVEIFFKGQHLSAQSILYDRKADRLTIEGPIRMDDGAGGVFMADQAELSADLTEGLLRSARIVLDQRLQMAAAQVQRSEGGRYTAMQKVTASSCTICAGSSTPLWEIRASEVVHDAEAQQIWFSNATLRFAGVPVLYLPLLRVPDPTLKRATGFLIPSIRSSTAQGTGLLLPYFITMGQNRDLLVTPYFTSTGNRTLNLRYRQAFAAGTLELTGAVTKDNIMPEARRGYFAVKGAFDLGNDYRLAIDGIMVSDRAYLNDYDITDDDRLDSRIGVTRVQRNLYFSAEVIGVRSLRDGDDNSILPSTITNLTFHRRFKPAILGGEGEFEIQSASLNRASTSELDSNGDGISDGRDMTRFTVKGGWRRNWTLANGMEIATEANAEADFYAIQQDSVYEGYPYRGTAVTGVELRWPWVKAGKDGTSQLIEPVVQLVVAPHADSSIPNEDSTLVEFDESNLFSLDRYPGADAFEGGTRVNLGMNYLITAANGASLGLTGGRVLRLSEEDQFDAASGLSGARSDWLVSASLANGRGLSTTARAIVDDTMSLTKGEMRFDLTKASYSLSGGYEYLKADASEDRSTPVREVVLNGSFHLRGNWRAQILERYDLEAQRSAKAGLKLTYQNECLLADLSVSRKYTTSTSVRPSTVFGLSVELLGFGGSSGQTSQRVCRR